MLLDTLCLHFIFNKTCTYSKIRGLCAYIGTFDKPETSNCISNSLTSAVSIFIIHYNDDE